MCCHIFKKKIVFVLSAVILWRVALNIFTLWLSGEINGLFWPRGVKSSFWRSWERGGIRIKFRDSVYSTKTDYVINVDKKTARASVGHAFRWQVDWSDAGRWQNETWDQHFFFFMGVVYKCVNPKLSDWIAEELRAISKSVVRHSVNRDLRDILEIYPFRCGFSIYFYLFTLPKLEISTLYLKF